MTPALWLGFFPDFKGGDTVLISGSSQGIKRLLASVRDFTKSATSLLPLHHLAAVHPRHPLEFFAVRGEATPLPSPRAYAWVCGGPHFEELAPKLAALCSSPSGHQYFELVGGSAQLIVSVGEYDGLWSQNDG